MRMVRARRAVAVVLIAIALTAVSVVLVAIVYAWVAWNDAREQLLHEGD